MLTGDYLRGHLDAILLRLIAECDRYGYELFDEIKKRTNQNFSVKEATLYAALQRLEKNGNISSYQGQISAGSKRRYYQITNNGNNLLNTYKNKWNEFKGILDTFMI